MTMLMVCRSSGGWPVISSILLERSSNSKIIARVSVGFLARRLTMPENWAMAWASWMTRLGSKC